jgi:hypothetical protein
MARKNKSSEEVPHAERYEHGLPFIGPTTTRPISHPDGKDHAVPTPRPSRFNEFMHRSEKTKGGE